jgi:hypothetical protein
MQLSQQQIMKRTLNGSEKFQTILAVAEAGNDAWTEVYQPHDRCLNLRDME